MPKKISFLIVCLFFYLVGAFTMDSPSSSASKVLWILPVPHENVVYSTTVYEIFYSRILILFVVLVFVFPILYGYIKLFSFVIVLLTLITLFPLLIKPWDVVVTNKRVVLRKKYWKIGRFSSLISFNLDHLETVNFLPRIKTLPLLVGYLFIQLALTLLEFGLVGTINYPTEIDLLIIALRLSPYGVRVTTLLNAIIYQIFQNFGFFSLILGIIVLILGITLFLFGFPHRTVLNLSSKGGHRVTINAGIPMELNNLLFGVSRKWHIDNCDNSQCEWNWELPLLEKETVKHKVKIGIISKYQQIIGLLAFLLFFSSLNTVFTYFYHLSPAVVIVIVIKLINFIFVVFTIRFAKRYSRIVITDKRLLIQKELQQISGLWGKRMYQYTDLPLNYLQGFRISYFSGLTTLSYLIIGIIFLTAVFFYIDGKNLVLILIPFVVALILMLFMYRTYLNLEILTIAGNRFVFGYQIPLIFAFFSHKIERKERLFHLFFANIINEEDIISLINIVEMLYQNTRERDRHLIIRFFWTKENK